MGYFIFFRVIGGGLKCLGIEWIKEMNLGFRVCFEGSGLGF